MVHACTLRALSWEVLESGGRRPEVQGCSSLAAQRGGFQTGEGEGSGWRFRREGYAFYLVGLHTFIVDENSIGSPTANTGGEMQGLGHAEVMVMFALWILLFGWSTG